MVGFAYSLKEEQQMLKFIIDNNYYDRVKGKQIYVEMSSEIGRTWQSLFEHFRRHLINKLDFPLFALTEEQKTLFKEGYNKYSVYKKRAGIVKKRVTRKRDSPPPEKSTTKPSRNSFNLAELTGSSSSDEDLPNKNSSASEHFELVPTISIEDDSDSTDIEK